MEGRVEGIVVESNGELVKVRVKHHGECSHCGACGGDLGLLIEARCPGGASTGDKVLVDLPEEKALKSAFVVYLLPLLGAGGGWLGGLALSKALKLSGEGAEIALAVAGLLCAFLYLKRYDKIVAGRQELPFAFKAGGASEETTKRSA